MTTTSLRLPLAASRAAKDAPTAPVSTIENTTVAVESTVRQLVPFALAGVAGGLLATVGTWAIIMSSTLSMSL